jgi:hypothetical protein
VAVSTNLKRIWSTTNEKRLSQTPRITQNAQPETDEPLMNSALPNETLIHPELGEVPARRLLDCVFALTPAGRILHYHLEQCEKLATDTAVRYTLTATAPRPERARCQVIPPFVNAFRRSS